MFQASDGSGKDVSAPKRYFKLSRSREERLLLRDRAMFLLVEQEQWAAADVADAFGVHRDTVYHSVGSFRQLMREVAERC
jgi:DNA-directed RNA polymerase specialized sigma24 family protein